MASLDEAKLAAASYRSTKEAAPEFYKARKSAMLEQALANYAYYQGLAKRELAQIKALSAAAVVVDDKDTDLAAIAAFAAEAVAVDAMAAAEAPLR